MFHIKLIGVDICPHRIVLKATDHVRRKFSKTFLQNKEKTHPLGYEHISAILNDKNGRTGFIITCILTM